MLLNSTHNTPFRADRINFVDEHYRRSQLLRHAEQLAHELRSCGRRAQSPRPTNRASQPGHNPPIMHPSQGTNIQTCVREHGATSAGRCLPSPRYFWISSDPTTRRNVALVWFATAFASSVLPVPARTNNMCFLAEIAARGAHRRRQRASARARGGGQCAQNSAPAHLARRIG